MEIKGESRFSPPTLNISTLSRVGSASLPLGAAARPQSFCGGAPAGTKAREYRQKICKMETTAFAAHSTRPQWLSVVAVFLLLRGAVVQPDGAARPLAFSALRPPASQPRLAADRVSRTASNTHFPDAFVIQCPKAKHTSKRCVMTAFFSRMAAIFASAHHSGDNSIVISHM